MTKICFRLGFLNKDLGYKSGTIEIKSKKWTIQQKFYFEEQLVSHIH